MNPTHTRTRMNLLMTKAKKLLPLATAALLLLGVFACGGGDDAIPNPSVSPGQLSCDALSTYSYEYSEKTFYEVGPTPTPPQPTGQGKSPFEFTTTINGKVQDGVKQDFTINNTDGHNKTEYKQVIIGNTYWINFGDNRGWVPGDTLQSRFPFPYQPVALCQAFVQDLNTSTLGDPTSETVNNVEADRYDFTGLPATFLQHSSDFSGDPSALVSTLDGSVWVAKNGMYPMKFEISGQGFYPSGQLFTLKVTYDISNMKGDISVEPPPSSS